MGLQRVRHDWVTELNWTDGWGSLDAIPPVQLTEFFKIWTLVSIREKLSSYVCSIQWYSWHWITAANSSKKTHRRHTAVPMHYSFDIQLVIYCQFFFFLWVLLRYNWHTALHKFKVKSMIWFTWWNDCDNVWETYIILYICKIREKYIFPWDESS